jgi:hypothetical protein
LIVVAALAVAEASSIAGATWSTLDVVRNVHVDNTVLAKPETA